MGVLGITVGVGDHGFRQSTQVFLGESFYMGVGKRGG